MASPFNINGIYTFEVYPSSILGTDYRNVTILGIMDYESALQFADIAALHANVYAHLPSGLPDDPSKTEYIRMRTSAGVVTILGLSWINLDTVEMVTSRTITVVIEDATNADVPRIQNLLTVNGFNNIKIS